MIRECVRSSNYPNLHIITIDSDFWWSCCLRVRRLRLFDHLRLWKCAYWYLQGFHTTIYIIITVIIVIIYCFVIIVIITILITSQS